MPKSSQCQQTGTGSKFQTTLETSEWRLSFSLAEKVLSESLSEFQKECYLVAKIVFYINFNKVFDEEEIDESKGKGRVLPSYLMKTIKFMLQETVAEEGWLNVKEKNRCSTSDLISDHDDADEDTNRKDLRNGEGIKKVVASYFKQLGRALEVGIFPCYFDNEMNLLVGFSKSFLKKVSGIAYHIASDVSLYLEHWPLGVIQEYTNYLIEGSMNAFILKNIACALSCNTSGSYNNTREATDCEQDKEDDFLPFISYLNFASGDPSSVAIQQVCQEIGLSEVSKKCALKNVVTVLNSFSATLREDHDFLNMFLMEKSFVIMQKDIQELDYIRQECLVKMKRDQLELIRLGLLDEISRNRRFDCWMNYMVRIAKARRNALLLSLSLDASASEFNIPGTSTTLFKVGNVGEIRDNVAVRRRCYVFMRDQVLNRVLGDSNDHDDSATRHPFHCTDVDIAGIEFSSMLHPYTVRLTKMGLTKRASLDRLYHNYCDGMFSTVTEDISTPYTSFTTTICITNKLKSWASYTGNHVTNTIINVCTAVWQYLCFMWGSYLLMFNFIVPIVLCEWIYRFW